MRRRRGRLERIFDAGLPIAVVLALGMLSMGVVRVVEVATPKPAVRPVSVASDSPAREQMRDDVRELAQTLDSGWAPEFEDGEEVFFVEDFAGLAAVGDPLAAPVDAAAIAGSGSDDNDENSPTSRIADEALAPPDVLREAGDVL